MTRHDEAVGLAARVPADRSPARQEGDRLVEEQARRQVQTFFDELKNGTHTYRTVANLRGEITQEYRGRCVLELLQNAHDALAESEPGDPRKISFVFTTEPDPELLIANSGRPFRREDFEGICELGQSPKDPEESVGNKGLGFQSVLEVSTRPQIWSTAATESDAAFAFEFDRAGTEKLVEQALAEIENSSGPLSRATRAGRLIIDWSREQNDRFRQRLADERVDPAHEARECLSPYSIPSTINAAPPAVDELLRHDHVTVIRLRLDGGRTGAVKDALKSIRDQLDQLDARSTVFLSHLERLTIEVDGERRILHRRVKSATHLPDTRSTREQLVTVDSPAGSALEVTTQEFRIWTRRLGGDTDPVEAQRIQAAVQHLPNRWPELREVEVAVAVEDRESPEAGVFVIFLPTELVTGTGGHINASFYGKLDRRHIDFDDQYNGLLLDYIAELCLDVSGQLVTGPGEAWRARAVIDLLASTGSPPVRGQPSLMDQFLERAEKLPQDLENASLILCDDGWQGGTGARIMPDVPDDDPLGKDRWRESADFSVVSCELDGRGPAVETLLERLGGSASPTPPEWADTIERLATRIVCHEIEATWDDFLTSLLTVLPPVLRSPPLGAGGDPLADAKFLPTEDGRLLCASDSAQVFFRPRREAGDAEEFVGRIPEALRDRIAFLHADVPTHEGPQRRNTEVQKFLDGRFVQNFRRDDLLRNVVVPALPALPALHCSPEARKCSGILAWTLALVRRTEREAQDEPPGLRSATNLLPLLQNLPVACGGGWFPISDAIFGPGWPGRHGEQIQTLADGLPGEAAGRLLQRALLHPSDERWGFAVAERRDLLAEAGVMHGLRLSTAEPLRFEMSADSPDLPHDSPNCTSSAAWKCWRETALSQLAPKHDGRFEYVLSKVRILPELEHLCDLGAPARRALSDLILASLDEWPDGWQRVAITKRRGHQWSTFLVSPLKHWLTTLEWLDDGKRAPMALSRRWLVPESLLQGREGRFGHLAPLPVKMTRRLGDKTERRRRHGGRRHGLLVTLKGLGLHVYPTEEDRTGPALLEALANAWERHDMPAGGFNVFLGQVRHAWKHLNPAKGLPKRFLVRTAAQSFSVRTDLEGVYLPDHRARTRSLRELGRPVLEMESEQARAAAGARIEDLKSGIRRASTLQERCIANEQPAVEAAKGATPIESSELRWLPSVLLTLAAHGGTRTGPATKSWDSALKRLQSARIQYCDSLTVELMDADQVVAGSEPGSHWLPNEGALLLRHGSSPVELAPACQAILERQDLLKDLRLVLGNVVEPTREQIERALGLAQVDAETFADIRDRCQSKAAYLVERLRPLLRALGVPDDLDGAEVETGTVTKLLSSHLSEDEVHRCSAEDMVRIARSARDDYELGREAYRLLGDCCQLPAWNDVLDELGEQYVPCVNSDAGEQTKLHIQEATPLLRALARHVAVEAKDPDLFLRMDKVSQNLEPPPDWSARWWEVPVDAVLTELRTAYVDTLTVDSSLVDALEDTSTLAELRTQFAQRGIALDVDPYETFLRNEDRLRKGIGHVHDLHRAWLEVSEGDPAPPLREAPEAPQMDSSAYLREWTEKEIFKRALGAVGDADFRRLCERCASTDDARLKLEITPETIDHARAKRHERRRQAEQKKRTFEIAGQPFVVDGAESYGDLLTRLDTLPIPKGPSVESDDSTHLVRPGPGPGPTPAQVPQTPRKTSHLYASPHLPGLVGIVGEIWAWRYLQSRFGRQVVTRAAWVSENGLKAQPLAGGEERDASDGHGFDFRFHCDGITWHFEVKATTEDGTIFPLPLSEIRAATRLANSRRDRWRILRVRRALTDEPEIDLLPNPFETGSSDLFRLSSGGMTVRYALDADP